MILEQVGNIIASVAREYPVLGLALTAHRTDRGKPLSLSNRPYLIELYADSRTMRDVVIRKAVQTGISEWMIQLILDAAGWRGRTAAYVLPTYTVRNRFVQKRVNPLLQSVKAYRDRCPGEAIGEAAKGGGENLALKRFGRGALMFLGSETGGDFIEFSADLAIVDEYDKCDSQNIKLIRDRIRESPFAQCILVGNPTLPRTGICKQYDESDRRKWFSQCSHCNERQNIDWFRNVVERDDDKRWIPRDRAGRLGGHMRPVCVRCGVPFDRVAKGALWVAEAPGNGTRGYAMSRLDILTESLSALYDEWLKAQGDPELIAAFYASVLGLGYEFDGQKLTDAHLEAACAGEQEMDRAGGDEWVRPVVTAGVDVGSVLNTTVSVIETDKEGNQTRRARFVTAARSFNEVADIFRRYHVDVAVVDAMPETHKAQELRDTFIEEGTTAVWLCRFHPTQRVDAQKYGMKIDYEAQVVQVDRTAVFDVTYADIVNGVRKFPSDCVGVLGWSAQMQAPVRVTNEANTRIIWTEGSAADHYRCSDVYDRIAMDVSELGGQYFGTS